MPGTVSLKVSPYDAVVRGQMTDFPWSNVTDRNLYSFLTPGDVQHGRGRPPTSIASKTKSVGSQAARQPTE